MIEQRSGSRLKGVRVVVVDDERDARELLEMVLLTAGAAVEIAASAPAAMMAIHAFSPDVLVSDIGMPEEDGYMLIERVRRLPPDRGGTLPAVALTAYAQPQDRARALQCGFDRHLVKPTDANELTAVITTLLARPT